MAKTKSFGTTVTVGGTAVGGLTDIQISGADRNFPDVTNHGSTGGYKEVVAGLKEPGTCELTYLFDDADTGQDALRTGGDTAVAVVVTLPNSKTASFSAFIGTPTLGVPLDDAVTQTCSLKITGAVTYS